MFPCKPIHTAVEVSFIKINNCSCPRLIHALGSLNPHGINERFTFYWSSVLRNLFVFWHFFCHTSVSFYFILFFTYLSHLRYLALHRYINTSIYNSSIHFDEGQQSKMSAPKLFSLRCKTYQFIKLPKWNSWACYIDTPNRALKRPLIYCRSLILIGD